MVLLYAPRIERILLYDDGAGVYLANNRNGGRPADDARSRTDPGAYNWDTPVDADTARTLLSRGGVLTIPCEGGFYAPGFQAR